jgi:hypothetical protein
LIAAIRAFGVPQVPAWRIGFVPHIRLPGARDRVNARYFQGSDRAHRPSLKIGGRRENLKMSDMLAAQNSHLKGASALWRFEPSDFC